MDTRDFEASVALHAHTLERFRPDVLVGSSFGGAVAVALLARGLWRGPTLLLAPALAAFGIAPKLPEDVAVTVVHGLRDEVVPIETSQNLAKTGTAGLVRLIELDDDHPLRSLVTTGKLAELVEALTQARDA